MRVSCAYGDHEEPPSSILKSAAQTDELDLTGNNFSDVAFLAPFVNLTTLVLDGNQISSQTKFPTLPKLHTLWLNKNEITNLSYFIDSLASVCPNIKYLSMMNNKACPNYFNGGTLQQYRDYRLFVISRFKNLIALEDTKVTPEERKESLKLYGSFKAQTIYTDPGRVGAKAKKKRVRVKTNFAAKEKEEELEEETEEPDEKPMAPKNDPTTTSVGPNPQSVNEGNSPTHGARLADDGEDEASSSDWSTDSGDMASPFLMKRQRSPSNLKREFKVDVDEKTGLEKKEELLGMLKGLGSKKKPVHFSDEENQNEMREEQEKNGSTDGSHSDEPEEREEYDEIKPKKKKKHPDLLQQELQARLKNRNLEEGQFE